MYCFGKNIGFFFIFWYNVYILIVPYEHFCMNPNTLPQRDTDTRPTQERRSTSEVQHHDSKEHLTEQEAKNIIEHAKPIPEQKEEVGFLDEAIEGLRSRLKKPKKKKSGSIPQVRDEMTVKVEKIMEEGLKDAFIEMTPVQQQEFKLKGEQTAFEIRNLLKAGKVKVKKVFSLLVEWLKMLPGVNRFFAEQEAKIKADKIISLKHHQ